MRKKKENVTNNEENQENIEILSSIDDIDLSNINIDALSDDNEKNSLKLGEVVSNVEKLNQAANVDDIDKTVDLVRYAFANNEDKPILLEKLLSDGDSRIKEISTINALQSQLNITKLAALEQTLLDDIIKSVENVAFLSMTEKLEIYNTISSAKERAQKQIFDYIKMARDFSSMPTIYRQLVDKLMIMPDDKISRLKVIPQLMDIPDELWDRIVEILKLWNS